MRERLTNHHLSTQNFSFEIILGYSTYFPYMPAATLLGKRDQIIHSTLIEYDLERRCLPHYARILVDSGQLITGSCLRVTVLCLQHWKAVGEKFCPLSGWLWSAAICGRDECLESFCVFVSRCLFVLPDIYISALKPRRYEPLFKLVRNHLINTSTFTA